ncbi:aminodeoxychorismate lyase [Luteibacter jiangsuensis]|uniref:Aminodeoxychorismate lyase n=1 Tax=Luteibacter jiangsuensis TaxID=637577 RepID=A0ABX0Q6C3_9GAMM|nr:aminodeoxychorismate lyase [Luteibacter jiangsuensis]NID06099.1 aminodeoxychorismate lyase [Luteibacter jiangsuensis]
MTPRTSVDFLDADRVSVSDRGFTYGDGLFETVRVVHGRAPLWPRHAARLASGCGRLRIPPPDMAAVLGEVLRLSAGLDDAVARITLTRGAGARGYAPPPAPRPTLVVTVSPLTLDPSAGREGVAVRLCATRLAVQPLLAGMKHLNRLEQVMARGEWDDPAIAEGLMLDADGHLVSATAANLFVVFDGRLATPHVDRCGVAGVARAEVMAVRDVEQVRLNLGRLMAADEVFLTSAVRGILPVRVFATRSWQPGPVIRALQAHWRDIGLPSPASSKDSDR